jgi:hypothetical protein
MPNPTKLVEEPGVNRTNLKALIARMKRDSGDRMSFMDAAIFAGMMIDRELRDCANEMAAAGTGDG